MALPRISQFLDVITNDNSKYLGCVPSTGRLVYSYTVFDHFTKFEVENASSGNGYVHIRNSSNNKYWVRLSGTDGTIVASAAKANENQESWDCTLFKPEFVKEYGTDHVIFLHVGDGQYVGKTSNNQLTLMPNAATVAKSRVMDYEQLVILPKYIAFKDDRDQIYQLHYQDSNRPYLKASGTDAAATGAIHETAYINRHGNYSFKNIEAGKYWRRSPNWIWADSTSAQEFNEETLFWAVKVSDSVIALRNLANERFIRRLTTEGKVDCMNASATSIINEARLTVIEPVISRSVTVTRFRLDDARIYGEKALVMGRNVARNTTSDPNHTTTLGFKYTETQSSTWDNSVTVTVGVTFAFRAGAPFIAEQGIEISTEVSNSYTWGETKETSKEIETSYTATVPPHTEITVQLVATEGKCDVPFTYDQTDTLYDGRVIRETFDDGFYTGVNSYNFHYEVTENPLARELWEDA